MSIECPSVWELLTWAVTAIKRPVEYTMSSNSFADDLQVALRNLKNDADRVGILEIEANNNVRNFYVTFTDWKERAEKDSREAQELLNAFDGESKTCCYGTFPDPKCRYQFSRRAEGKIQVIKQLTQECNGFKELNDISYSNPTPGYVTALNSGRREGKDVVQPTTSTASASSASTLNKHKDDDLFESRATIIKDITVALADDSNSVVGIHGMGGVGKSTLLVYAERRIREEQRFNVIAKVDVSQNPDIMRIQGEIAVALGLSDIKNKEFVSERAKLLHERLEKEERNKTKVLIILDNLWEGLDLNKVGIPCGHDNKVIGCKLLLTSRYRDVLRRDMGCDKDFLLGGLQKEEAKRLFERMVADKVHDDEYKPLVDVALDKCAGMPFLIVAMAKRFRDAELSEWKDTLDKIEKSKDKEINDLIVWMMQWSYDKLEEEVKSLLQLCVVYGISKPSLENLVRYGVGLGLFQGVSSMEKARNRLSSHIRTLQASSLLLDSEDVDGFKIHDLVREFVASVSLRDHPLLMLKDKSEIELLKDKPHNYVSICFPYIDMEELPQELNCPKLRIFLLFTNNESLHVPDSLFNSMRKLMVLNLTGVHLTHSPLPFQLWENLHTLCLDGCLLEDVAFLGKLKRLQILSLVNSKIQRLPKEIGQLVELRLLDLNNCPKLEIIEPSVLGSLIKLEELYMKNSFDKWNAGELQTPPTNASLAELNNMKKLCTLYVFIPDPSVLPNDLYVETLTKYKIQIGNARRHRDYEGSSTLELKLSPLSNILQKECIQSILGKTDDLFLDGLDTIEQSICALSQKGFSKLKHLQVENSCSIHYIHQSPSHTDFKRLELLILKDLVNLEKLWPNHISSKSFLALKVVRLERCHKMEVLFPLSSLRELPWLEEIEVINCKLMQGIVEVDDCGKVQLCNLHKLRFSYLPNIKNFFIAGSTPSSSTLDDQVGTEIAFFNGQKVLIPSLEFLEMEGLPNLKDIWSNESPLKLLQLHKLHTLRISDCNSVQVIFDLGGPVASGDVETKSKLSTLHLDCLPSLRCIWNKNLSGIVSFHDLKKLVVYFCDLEFMFFRSMVKSLTQLRDLTIKYCNKMEMIIMEEEGLGMEISETLAFPMLTNLCLDGLESLRCFSCEKCSREAGSQDCIQSRCTALFNQEVSMPSLESLTMKKIPNLKEIWSDEFSLEMSNLRSLEVVHCESLSKVISFRSLVKLPKLHTLRIENCISMQEIFDLDRPSVRGTVETLPELTILKLSNMQSLRHIWNKNPCGIESFHSLKKLEVWRCDNLGFIFFPSMVKFLTQLRDLTISYCKNIEVIIMEEEGLGMKISETLAFSMLTNISLENLDSLTCFSRGKCSREARSQDHIQSHSTVFFNREVSVPSMESLEMVGLPNLRDIWRDESPLKPSNLRSLKVSFSNSLAKVISSKSLLQLHKLQTLNIIYCKSVQVIFDLGGPIASGNVETLFELATLDLNGLHSLKRIWSKNPSGIVSFHNLKKLKVEFCDNLGFMFYPSMVKSLTQLRVLKVCHCNKMEVIIMEEEGLGLEISETLAFPMLTDLHLESLKRFTCFSRGKCSQKGWSQDRVKSSSIVLFNQEVAFPSLKTLYVTDLDNIEMIWDNQVVVVSFSKLKSLIVEKCKKLVNIVHSFILRQLLSLERLEARRCGSLEVVCELQPLNLLDGHPIALPLKELTVSELPKLKCVWDKKLHHQVKFQCLRSISISRCKSLYSLFPVSVAEDLMQLEELKIDECGIAELIEKDEEREPRFVFPNLTSLKLTHLAELKYLYTGKHTSQWPALKTLTVDGCNKVEILASQIEDEMPPHKQPLFSIEKGAFPNLQKLKLDLSEQMEICHGHFHDEEFFCKLRVLELHHLSKESTISTCHFAESLTNLEELVVCESYLGEPSSSEEAIEGTSLELKVILPFPRCVNHMRALDVSSCDGLPYMFAPAIAENLVALKRLRISNCKTLSKVISDEEGEERCVVTFNQLKYMELDGLIKLRCFNLGGYTLMFPLLEDVIMNGCPNMKFFSEGQIEAPKLKRVQVGFKELYEPKSYQSFWKGNLNITIQIMFEEMGAFAGLKTMLLSEFPELIGKWHSELNPIKSSWQLRSLTIDKCPSFVKAIPSRLMLVVNHLCFLQVCDCECLEEIFDLEGLEAMESTCVLPVLRELNLFNLPKLRRLWSKDLPELLRFECLDILTIYNCSNLRHAFTPSMVRCLAHLRWLVIKECDLMEGVIVDKEGQGSVAEKITFPELKWLNLECLPSLTSFLWGKNHTLEFLELSDLSIAHCPNMRSLTRQSPMEIDNGTPSLFTPQVQSPWLESIVLSHMDNLSKIWTNGSQETLAFDYLWKVEAQNCKSLKNLFPHWVATSLTRLQKLQVESCGIEEIVASGDNTQHSDTAQALLPKLISLVLHDMPQLQSFCPNLPTLNWPLLNELRVTHCDKLNMLSFATSMNSWAQRDDQQDLSNQEARSSFERDFPMLEKLLLVDENIQMIQDAKFPEDNFGKPKALILACFHDEKAVFPPRFFLERFQNLQSIEVFCSSFEDIFPDEGPVEKGKHPVLENLRELKLNKLHNLKRVWRENSLVSKILESIETFEVWDCPCLTTIFPAVTSFQNLTELVVKNSSGLIYLVTVSMVTNLMLLKRMTIIECERMKEVVTNDGNGEGKVISFGNLQYVTLKHLPDLECFSSILGCTFRFPSLSSIEVEECPKMKTFSKGMLSTPQLRSMTLFRYNWQMNWRENVEDLNATIQKLSA